jgi:hypothetical protein
MTVAVACDWHAGESLSHYREISNHTPRLGQCVPLEIFEKLFSVAFRSMDGKVKGYYSYNDAMRDLISAVHDYFSHGGVSVMPFEATCHKGVPVRAKTDAIIPKGYHAEIFSVERCGNNFLRGCVVEHQCGRGVYIENVGSQLNYDWEVVVPFPKESAGIPVENDHFTENCTVLQKIGNDLKNANVIMTAEVERLLRERFSKVTVEQVLTVVSGGIFVPFDEELLKICKVAKALCGRVALINDKE